MADTSTRNLFLESNRAERRFWEIFDRQCWMLVPLVHSIIREGYFDSVIAGKLTTLLRQLLFHAVHDLVKEPEPYLPFDFVGECWIDGDPSLVALDNPSATLFKDPEIFALY